MPIGRTAPIPQPQRGQRQQQEPAVKVVLRDVGRTAIISRERSQCVGQQQRGQSLPGERAFRASRGIEIRADRMPHQLGRWQQLHGGQPQRDQDAQQQAEQQSQPSFGVLKRLDAGGNRYSRQSIERRLEVAGEEHRSRCQSG